MLWFRQLPSGRGHLGVLVPGVGRFEHYKKATTFASATGTDEDRTATRESGRNSGVKSVVSGGDFTISSKTGRYRAKGPAGIGWHIASKACSRADGKRSVIAACPSPVGHPSHKTKLVSLDREVHRGLLVNNERSFRRAARRPFPGDLAEIARLVVVNAS